MNASQLALQRAVEVAGSQSALAKILGGTIKQQHVSYWLNADDALVPAEHCATIEAGTGVSRHDLRPDVFGPAPIPQAAAS